MCVYTAIYLSATKKHLKQKNNQKADQDQQQIQNFWKKKSKVIFNSFKSFVRWFFTDQKRKMWFETFALIIIG